MGCGFLCFSRPLFVCCGCFVASCRQLLAFWCLSCVAFVHSWPCWLRPACLFFFFLFFYVFFVGFCFGLCACLVVVCLLVGSFWSFWVFVFSCLVCLLVFHTLGPWWFLELDNAQHGPCYLVCSSKLGSRNEAGFWKEEVLKGLRPRNLGPAQPSGSVWPFGAT